MADVSWTKIAELCLNRYPVQASTPYFDGPILTLLCSNVFAQCSNIFAAAIEAFRLHDFADRHLSPGVKFRRVSDLRIRQRDSGSKLVVRAIVSEVWAWKAILFSIGRYLLDSLRSIRTLGTSTYPYVTRILPDALSDLLRLAQMPRPGSNDARLRNS